MLDSRVEGVSKVLMCYPLEVSCKRSPSKAIEERHDPPSPPLQTPPPHPLQTVPRPALHQLEFIPINLQVPIEPSESSITVKVP
jgi:hypothetical protein